MTIFTFAGDESGDVSFSFEKGASRYFVVSMIATTEPQALRQVLSDLRTQSRLPTNYEFSFHSLSSAALRQRTFQALARSDFECWAVMVDKPSLPDSFRVMRRLDFYLYFVTELVQTIPARQRGGATLILDEFGSPETMRAELRRFLTARNIPQHFKRILPKRSTSEPLIQVADLMAGAILRRDARRDAEAFDWVERRVKRIVDFRAE